MASFMDLTYSATCSGESFPYFSIIRTIPLPTIAPSATDAIFLDAETHTLRAQGSPRQLLDESHDETLIRFLTRGERSS